MASAAQETASWTSPHSGWHAKSNSFEEHFTPTRSSLQFVQLLNSPPEPDGFIVAFFDHNIVVDSMGRVLLISSESFEAIVQLARKTLDLPDTGSFRNTWRVKHGRTGRDIQRLLVKQNGSESLKETSVYGYAKDLRILENETQGRTTLPCVLIELFGLLNESREGYSRGGADPAVIDAIKALL